MTYTNFIHVKFYTKSGGVQQSTCNAHIVTAMARRLCAARCRRRRHAYYGVKYNTQHIAKATLLLLCCRDW